MTCCSHARRKRAEVPGSDRIEVQGTWDFKWPLDTTIRVAFQRPSSAGALRHFEAVKGIICELARQWTNPPKGHEAAIAFSWVDDFEPQDDTDPQNGSPFDHPASGKAVRDYDVLVSLEPLPLGIRHPVTIESLERIFLPRSELGTFARRIDYAVPTLYLGPFGGAPDFDLARHYRENRLARYYVVHEFGHVLGLAHEHQSPSRRRSLNKLYGDLAGTIARVSALSDEIERDRSALRIGEDGRASARLQQKLEERHHLLAPFRDRLRAFFATQQVSLSLNSAALDDFIVGQLLEPWPGSERFSDWQDPQGQFEVESIMNVPRLGCLLGLPGHAADCAQPCEPCDGALDSKPRLFDYEQLAMMYPLAEAPEAVPPGRDV